MDIATRYVFTSPSVKFDEYQFPGLPDKKPNPNLFPYRSCLPHMNPTIDKVEDLISPSNADENCGSVDLSTKSPPRKKSRTRKDVPEIPQSAEEGMESGPRTSLGAELDITYPQGDSPQGVELRTKRQHRQGVELPIRTNEGIPSPQGVELRTKRQRQNEKPNHRNATTKVPALRPGVNTVSADMHTDHPAWERTISMINLMSGLTYFDLVEDELFTSLTSREAGPSSFLRDEPIPNSSRPTMLIALSHGRKGPGDGAGSKSNIRVDINGDPLDFRSAMEQDYVNWQPAVMSEIESLITIKCFDFTLLPPGKTAIGCRWVFKRKTESIPVADRAMDFQKDKHPSAMEERPHNKVRTRYKARLVAKGYEQEYGANYWQTFSPTPRLTTFRMLIALASFFGWDVHQLDICTAFLNAKLEAEVFMEVPEGMEYHTDKFLTSKGLTHDTLGDNKVVLRLLKSLYGLKQSSHEWNKDIDKKLKTLGFQQCDADPNLYIPTFKDGCFLLLYVDDILLVGPSHGIRTVKNMIMPLYKMRDLGPATLYLGIEINRLSDGRIKLSQTQYIEKTLERYNMLDCNGVLLPLKKELDSTDEELLSPNEHKEYQSLVGALNWTAVVTRPDLAYTLSRLSKYLSKPARIHKDAAKHALRYLAGTKDYGLIYGCKADPDSAKLIGYTDSNFAADTDNRRSTSGFLFKLNGASIHWQSKQQSLVARSTHEAEYVGMAIASYEISYLRKLLADISHTPIHDMEPTLLYGDNIGAIATATNSDGNKTTRSKHIDIRYHITREALANGTLRLQYIRTTDMTADILTKALPIEALRRHRHGMGLDQE